MRKAHLFALLVAHVTSAQTWCPPGATWTHDYGDALLGYVGIQRAEYIGDTMVGGFTAQELRQTHVVAPWGTTDYAPYTTASLFTRLADDIVYIWDGVSAYDTMFWYGAVPGDRYHAPGWPDDGTIEVTVLDTATVDVQGVPLRRLVLEHVAPWPVDTVYERIGSTFFYLNGWSWYVTDMPWNGLLCYSDQDIDLVAPGVSDCGLTLSASEASGASGPLLFPNPGSDRFTLDLSSGSHTIILFDAKGRKVLHQRTTDARPVIDTGLLPAGLYHIAVRDEQGAMIHATWVKE